MPVETTIHEKTREIKKELRLAMNGIVSSLQRNHGLNYKINFGVEIPRLKDIAANHAQDKELAFALWQDNIRECKLLAILLLPQENYVEVAEKWTAEAPFTEIADHLTKTILCTIPNAIDNALSNIQRAEGLFRYCGYLTLAHLLRSGMGLTEEQEKTFLTEIRDVSDCENRTPVITTAYNSLVHYVDNQADGYGKAQVVFGEKEGKLELLETVVG